MNIGVVGAGIFGVASAIELRSRGHAVTVFEQGSVPNEMATSTDVSKAIRRTWYAGDNETYVELAERAGVKWREWERRSGAEIYHQVGGINIFVGFDPGTAMYESVLFLTDRGAELQVLNAEQARDRFPQFRLRDEETCVYDPWAGYLESGRAVRNLAQLARESGVQVLENEPVAAVEEGRDGVTVRVGSGQRTFDRVVVATGVWMGRLLPQIGSGLRVTHQQMVLIKVKDPGPFSHGSLPVWSIDPDKGGWLKNTWYGFPMLREGYVKVSREGRGDVVDPDLDRQGTQEFVEQTMEFLRERIPGMATGKAVEGRSCLYANTPDDHFVIDWAPGSSRILAAGGGSGHGFKFGGSIGEVVADAVEEKRNPLGDLFRIGDRFTSDAEATLDDRTRGFAMPSRG